MMTGREKMRATTLNRKPIGRLEPRFPALAVLCATLVCVVAACNKAETVSP